MSHHDATHAPSPSDCRFLLTAGVLFLLLLAVVGSMLLTRSGSATETEDAESAALRMKNLAELQAADTALLNSTEADDGFDGGHIPISRAMELVIPSLNTKSVGAPNQKQP